MPRWLRFLSMSRRATSNGRGRPTRPSAPSPLRSMRAAFWIPDTPPLWRRVMKLFAMALSRLERSGPDPDDMEPQSQTRARVLRVLGVLVETWQSGIPGSGRSQRFSVLSDAQAWTQAELMLGRSAYLSTVELCERRSFVAGAVSIDRFTRNVPLSMHHAEPW